MQLASASRDVNGPGTPALRRAWAILLVVWLGCWAVAAGAQTAAGQGFLDRAQLEAGGQELRLNGWAAPEEPGVFVTNAIVTLGGREVYRGRLNGGAERADVGEATGRPAWRHSGFELRVRLPRALPPGPQALQVRIRLGDGREFMLERAPSARTLDIAAPARPSARATGLLLLALAVPLAAWLLGDAAARRLPGQATGARVFGLAGATSFALLVASGATGSSLALLLEEPAVTVGEPTLWAGTPRVQRSDEWQVYTPQALAQAAHQPRFPVVNSRIGGEGQNMLVLGMTAVPVAHPSALAKPATWGFFLFDTSHALAWAWWLPLWGGLGAAWLLQRRLLQLHWRPAAALAAGLVLAPYSVAFSHWPAYLAMFALLGLCSFRGLLGSQRWPAAVGWGLLLGWSAAGFALVLYPPWQISLATLAMPLALAWAWRDRAQWRWGWATTLGVAMALALAAGLLGSWWLDARDAVAAMRATVYPGQRGSEAGGDIDRWFLLKGWLNPFTLHADTGAMWAVEAASFQFLWGPTLLAVGWRLWRARRLDPVPLALLGFAAFALAFQFFGWAAWLVQVTLWKLVTSYRLDLALGLAQLLLLAWLLAPPAQDRADLAGTALPQWAALAGAAAAAVQARYEFTRMPLDIAAALPAGVVLLCALAVAAAAYLLVRQQRAGFLALFLGWTLAAALPYHPLSQAPAALSLAPPLQGAGLADGMPDAAGRRGVAVIGQRNWAMTLPAVGVPVANTVLYYPQPSLWQRLDPNGVAGQTYNRYQRLIFELEPQAGERRYRIESPRLDEVRVHLDPARFDFRLLGARWVLLPAAAAGALAANSSLEPVAGVPAAAPYALLRVRP